MKIAKTLMVAALPLALAAGCETARTDSTMVDTTARSQAQQAQDAANRAAASAQQAADSARQAAAAAERAANEAKAASDRSNAMFNRQMRKR